MSKKIIYCADGTWNTPHGPSELPEDTNVRKLFLLLTEGARQLKYYDSGVGTNGAAFEHFLAARLGKGLFRKVQEYSLAPSYSSQRTNVRRRKLTRLRAAALSCGEQSYVG